MEVRDFFRYLEGMALFVAMPLMMYWNLLPLPKIAVLLLFTIGCLVVLWLDKDYNIQRLNYRPQVPGQWKKILVRSGLVSLAIIILTLFLQPDQLLGFPRQRPMFWGIVMLLYPLFSALPQELIYREFFFHRYEKLLGSTGLMIAASAVAFSFLHIIYDNNWAIIISLMGGFIFARTYSETRSLYWVSVEHAIYGCLLFTFGLGNYFYEGV